MIIIGSDHGGLELKNYIKQYLLDKGYQLQDIGAKNLDPLDDFSYYGKLVATQVAKDTKNNKGIFLCGSGVGACIVCNRQKGCYAANCHSVEQVVLSRQHNNLNILNLGGRFIDKDLAIKMVDAFLNTDFLGGKYQDRLEDIDK